MANRGAIAAGLAVLVAAVIALLPGPAQAQSGGLPATRGPRFNGQPPLGCLWDDTSGRPTYICIYADGSGATWSGPSDSVLLASRTGQAGPIQFTPAGLAFFGLTPPAPAPPSPPAPVASAPSGAFEATITNDFSGYAPERIFVLSNGQIWQQTEAWYWYWYWAYPQVLIYPTAGGWKLHFDQIDHDVYVQRLR